MRRSINKHTLTFDGDVWVSAESRSLYYEFKSRPSLDVSLVPVDMDIPLDKSVAKQLGFKSVAILKGRYRVDSTIGKFGGAVFDVAVTK